MWRNSGVEVIYSDDGLTGLFSFAKAINRARKRAKGDCFLSYSVDALPPTKKTLEHLTTMLANGIPWVAGWKGQTRFTEIQTSFILGGADPDHVGTPGGGISIGREALVAVRADVWDALGGYDERFVGWGPEDKAWHLALQTVFPSGCDEASEELFPTLWHPATPRTLLQQNIDLFREYRRQAKDDVGFLRWYSSRWETTQ